ncbi:unnamed protein product [Rotaria sordida]|uniref:Uncharacterized protein n=1 Tax=Rotaria sordida TaxID=392033 RepID=A0A818S4T1_9BILA|nr:unnamed protein product [Rotaria sordida]CAF3660985.1 unnamed protein product [Rotaria sordida]CAF3977415.1 unnamed protein product [Rotaria sordida]
MLMMYFAIFTLLLASRITSLSLPSPAIVYSAVIYNEPNSPVRCNVFRSLPSGHLVKFGPFTVRKHEHYSIKEVKVNMGTWTAAAIIEKIQCENLVLTAPFDHVISPVKNWKFVVRQHKIVSVGPS